MARPICKLEIWRTEQIAQCARLDNGSCLLRTLGQPAGITVIPASVLLDDSQGEHNVWSKRLTFDVADRGNIQRLLDLLGRHYLVAVYTDEHNVRRVCGSMRYPLQLTTSTGRGRISCQLSGTGEYPDPELMVGV